MTRWKKLLSWTLVAAVLVVGTTVTIQSLTKDSKLHPSRNLERQITSFALNDPIWDIKVTPEKIASVNQILNQPYFFIGQGKQCTAYVSKDGQYVLKFLLQKPLVVKPVFERLPDIFPFTLLKKYKVYKRKKRKNELFSSFMLSYNVIPEQTGMVFVHLNSTQALFKPPLIVDTKACPVSIDTDKTQFVIQKRARHLKPVIIDLMWDGKVDEAKKRVDWVLELLYDCAKKRVIDVDQGLVRNNNIGLTETRAIYIDTGKLRLVKERIKRKDFVKDLKRLKPFYRWLQVYYPELATRFQERQQELIKTY